MLYEETFWPILPLTIGDGTNCGPMNEPSQKYTTNPLSYAEPVPIEPEFIRLPRTGQRDPLFGLSRGYLNYLILPSRSNGFKPKVRSCVLRKKGAKSGVRLIEVKSLREYIRSNAEQTAEP